MAVFQVNEIVTALHQVRREWRDSQHRAQEAGERELPSREVIACVVRSRSITPFGQSGDPASPHFFDQAPLFAQGRFKPTYFTMDEIRANLERAYRPGEERR